jgi:hypothetical protein
LTGDDVTENVPDYVSPKNRGASPLVWTRINPYLPFRLELSPWWSRVLTGGGTTALDGIDGDDLNLEDVGITIDGSANRSYMHAFVTEIGSPYTGYVQSTTDVSTSASCDGYEAENTLEYLLFDPSNSTIRLSFPDVNFSDMANATISSATVYLYPLTDNPAGAVGSEAVIHGVLTDNDVVNPDTITPTETTDAFRAAVTMTTATQTLDLTVAQTLGTPVTWDVTAIVAEIIAGGGFTSGGYIQFLVDDSESSGASQDWYFQSHETVDNLDVAALANLDDYDGRWTMDTMVGTTVSDYSANGYDLTATNIGGSGNPLRNAATVKEGQYSMEFTGANNHVLTQDVATAWSVAAGDYNLISVWVKFNDYTSGDQGIVSAGGPFNHGANGENWSLYMYNSGKICFSICDTEGDVGGRAFSAGTPLADNNWHHILFSFSRPTRFDLNPQCKLFVDAIPESLQFTSTGALDPGWGGGQPATTQLHIGMGWESDVGTGLGFGSAAMYMDGFIDDVAVYDDVSEMGTTEAVFLYNLRATAHQKPRLEIVYTYPNVVEDSPMFVIPDNNANSRLWTLTSMTVGNDFEIYHDTDTATQGGSMTLKHIDLFSDVTIDAYEEYLRVRTDTDSDRFIFEVFNAGDGGVGIKLGNQTIYEWSTDGGMTGNSDTAIPTEKAVRTYVSNNADEKVAVDSSAVAGYLGSTAGAGVLRSDASLLWTDGGDFVTLAVDHDAATNFVSDEHIAHSGVILTAGDGLSGGGDITASRSFAVNVDDSTIEINADTLRVKADGINDTHIDWGTGANQVSAVDVPIADAGSYFSPATEVETALQEIGVNIRFFNGTFVESFDATVSEAGGVVTLSLEQSGGGDLTMVFSDGSSQLDCTDPVQTIELTVGASDAAPQVIFHRVQRWLQNIHHSGLRKNTLK